MGNKLSALIDVCVILDVLQHREPYYETSARVLSSAETGTIDGSIAAHTVTTLFYLITRFQSTERARAAIGQLLGFLSVAAVDQAVIEQALTLPYPDFEDAVQMVAAVRAGARYLVTRNVQDYKAGPLPVLQPAEFLTLL